MDQIDYLNPNILADINISLVSTLSALLASMVSAAILRKAYMSYGKSMNNREYFGNIFILLAVTTCSVIIIVKYSLALSLGLVGALSIVRFRAAIKEPEELVYLFLVIALGLSFGSSQFAVGASLLFMSIFIIYVTSKLFSRKVMITHTGMLCIISGPRTVVSTFKDGDLIKILEKARYAIIKELSFTGETGRVVVRMSSGSDGDEVIRQLDSKTSQLKLDFQMISEVSVPA
ncbi:DUF4956 domain-containing protein [Planktomarina temperata]|nr:DUF4956 domain-containing protein [Planktomarina temperata]